ncbi:hypothetical protein EUX98_g5603 [Antrodiella citrinella]|uniref:AB hydrolase-1 domain-containing protein n=1 Tax=Antrodiella citrinella TaxID=2447956 RepID=A0A4V3XIB8_9APHY|nr:hypothetical protein EUX98_g5603 [Antrodiella citrinella]
MNPAHYKDLVNSRGYKYHYYAVPAKGDCLTIVMVHGFPTTSRMWRLVVPFFEEKGYGVIVPDMLAYGGTDKPTDYKEYQYSLLNKDIIDILDTESVKQAVAIGHDWGSGIVSRLPNFYPDRFVGYAFMNVAWVAPNPNFTLEQFMAQVNSITGYDNFGYWYFFSEEGADKIIEAHIESFMSATFPKEPQTMKHAFALKGALKNSLLSNFKAPLGDFLTDKEQQIFIDTFRKNGFAAPLCYYKIMTRNARGADDATIPKSQLLPPLASPLFFGAALQDPVCLAAAGKAAMASRLPDHNVTIRDFDGDHWMLEYPAIAEEVNRELHVWLETVVTPPLKARV